MERERLVLDASPVKHAPTIGSMYEGLSQDLLLRSVPAGIELQVVGGFITDGGELQSGQIDCMLVKGEGEPVPYTSLFRWHVKDVVAVFEIKKTLYADRMAEAFEHLREVQDVEASYNQTLLKSASDDVIDLTSVDRAFAQTTEIMPPPYDAIDTLPDELEAIYHTLVGEHFGPLRVVIGFHGFKSEQAFREALFDYLRENTGKSGFGVHSFPQLIVSGDFSMVKANGDPYSVALTDEGWWPFYFSTAVNPVLMILELLWTRLEREHSVGMPWGDDLEIEVPHAFLLARAGRHDDGRRGWNYKFVNSRKSNLEALGDTEPWEPSFLSEAQFFIISLLGRDQPVILQDAGLLKFLAGMGVTDAAEFWEELLDTRLVARTSDGTRLVLIDVECQTAFLPDGRIVAADANSGRLLAWVKGQTSVPPAGNGGVVTTED